MPKARSKAKPKTKAKAAIKKKAVYSHPMHHVNWRFVAIVAMVVVALLFVILLSYMSTIRTAVASGSISL